MPVSDETKDFLDEAKKGKARKFVMLTKGTSIISLVVYKKGAPSKFIKEAKESGKGLPCFGTIEGRGMDLTFKLAMSDGFKDAPVKDVILKKFLEDEADFKCKPAFEIVETLPIVLDESDPLHARFLQLQPLVVKALDNSPGRAEEINTLFRQIGGYLDADQRDQGQVKLVELETLIKDLTAGGGSSAENDKQRDTYLALRQKLEPLLLKAQRANPEKATALGNVWNYADSQADVDNFGGANKTLAGLAEALKKTLEAAPKTDAEKLGIRQGIVAETVAKFSRAKERWDIGIQNAAAEMQKVQQGVRTDDPELAEALGAVLEGYQKELDALLVAGAKIGAESETAEKQRDAALSKAKQLKGEVLTDDLLAFLDTYDGAKVTLQSVMAAALSDVESQLAVA